MQLENSVNLRECREKENLKIGFGDPYTLPASFQSFSWVRHELYSPLELLKVALTIIYTNSIL